VRSAVHFFVILLKYTTSVPLVEDSDFFLESLDPDLFPGVDSSVKVHNGFKDAQAASSSAVLEAVQSTIASTGTSNVAVVGHSLGAAIALIDTMFLSLNLPDVNVRHIGYGLPRVSIPISYTNERFID
jgi:predicted lipase